MAHATTGRPRVVGVQPTQVLAFLVGLFFLVIGIVGLGRGGFTDFAGHDHANVLVFTVNPLHNLVHGVLGLIGLVMSVSSVTARLFGWVLFVAYGVLFVWGMMLAGVVAVNPVSAFGNPLNLGPADNWLHLGAAVVGLAVAIMPARRRVVTATEPEPEPAATEPEPEPAASEPPRPTAEGSQPEGSQPEGSRSGGFRGLLGWRRSQASR